MGVSLLNAPIPRRIDTALGPVEYAEAGAGPSLLCLHGAMGGWDQSWLLGRAIAPAGFHIIAVSRPGYLGTPVAALHEPEYQAALLAALLDRLGIEKTFVAAVSGGGPSALAFALNHAERCHGLIMVSAPTGRHAAPPGTVMRLRLMALVARLPGLAAWLRRRLAKGRTNRVLDSAEAMDLLAATRASVVDRLSARTPGTLRDIASNIGLPGFLLDDLQVPVLGLYGDSDPVVPLSHGERLGRIPGGRLVILTGGEHVALFTHLDEVRREVATFLATNHCGAA